MGVLRGIHCSPYSKLITVIEGSVHDVIVDLREDSPTFLKWCAIVVSSENQRQIFIPAGCGHGFLCLEDCKMLYVQGGCFDPPRELDLSPFDPTMNIIWPVIDGVSEYTMSAKDMQAPNLLNMTKFQLLPICQVPLRRILIIGASGQVGGALMEAFGHQNVIGTYSKVHVPGMIQFDLQDAARDPKVAEDLITLCQPEVVCICAGRTWVDGCENEGEIPTLVNAVGPREVARAAKVAGARSVYFSTDYVFSGDESDKVYDETDPCDPQNIYGSSKLAGEQAILTEDPDALIIRTTGVFGPEQQGKNFVYQLCNAIAQKRDIQCAVDSFGSPTYNRDLAALTVDLLEARVSGIYHCVGPETIDRYSFAVLVAQTFGLDASCIKRTDSESLYHHTLSRLGFAARRGKHLGLSIKKVTEKLGRGPRDLASALTHWKENQRGALCTF